MRVASNNLLSALELINIEKYTRPGQSLKRRLKPQIHRHGGEAFFRYAGIGKELSINAIRFGKDLGLTKSKEILDASFNALCQCL